MMVYRCDICKDVEADNTVPHTWRWIVVSNAAAVGDEDGERLLACTACVASFKEWRRVAHHVRPIPTRRNS